MATIKLPNVATYVQETDPLAMPTQKVNVTFKVIIKFFMVFWISCDPQNFYLLQIQFLVTLHVKFSLHSGIASNPLSDYVTVM